MIKLFLIFFGLSISICLSTPVINKPGTDLNDFEPGFRMEAALNMRKDVKQDPKLDLDLYQGDIILPKNHKTKNKNAINPDFTWTNKWTNNIVPYIIDSNAGFSATENRMIKSAMYRIQSVSCIRFRERRNEYSYVNIRRHPETPDVCSSWIGKSGGVQDLNLGVYCFFDERQRPSAGTAMHEFLHLLGFFHEQSRSDRDGYVQIIERNILDDPRAKAQFGKVDTNNLGAPYDTCSIMHYSQYAFSKSRGLQTIKVIKPNNCTSEEIGHSTYLSNYDIRKLNTLYSCQGYPQVKSNTNPTNPGNQNCVDKDQRCPGWAPYCDISRYIKWMNVNCALTCGQCQGTGNPAQGCADTRNDCEEMMKAGLCWLYPKFSKNNCSKTCKVCHL